MHEIAQAKRRGMKPRRFVRVVVDDRLEWRDEAVARQNPLTDGGGLGTARNEAGAIGRDALLRVPPGEGVCSAIRQGGARRISG